MDKLINGIKQSVGPVMDHRFHSLRGFGAIQLRVYHELPRMKVILTDNATNYIYILRKVFQFPFACRKLGINFLKGICLVELDFLTVASLLSRKVL